MLGSSRRSPAMPPRATPPAPSAAAPAAAGAVRPEHIELAHALADAAAVVTSRYFRTPVPVDIKADASPVTIADQQAEAAMQALIKGRFPEHSIFGEEEGFHAGSGDGSYMWVIDPIDGTKSFITGGGGPGCGRVGGWGERKGRHALTPPPHTLQASLCGAPSSPCCTGARPCWASSTNP